MNLVNIFHREISESQQQCINIINKNYLEIKSYYMRL